MALDIGALAQALVGGATGALRGQGLARQQYAAAQARQQMQQIRQMQLEAQRQDAEARRQDAESRKMDAAARAQATAQKPYWDFWGDPDRVAAAQRDGSLDTWVEGSVQAGVPGVERFHSQAPTLEATMGALGARPAPPRISPAANLGFAPSATQGEAPTSPTIPAAPGLDLPGRQYPTQFAPSFKTQQGQERADVAAENARQLATLRAEQTRLAKVNADLIAKTTDPRVRKLLQDIDTANANAGLIRKRTVTEAERPALVRATTVATKSIPGYRAGQLELGQKRIISGEKIAAGVQAGANVRAAGTLGERIREFDALASTREANLQRLHQKMNEKKTDPLERQERNKHWDLLKQLNINGDPAYPTSVREKSRQWLIQNGRENGLDVSALLVPSEKLGGGAPTAAPKVGGGKTAAAPKINKVKLRARLIKAGLKPAFVEAELAKR